MIPNDVVSTGQYTVTLSMAAKAESNTPSAYRLAKKPDGTLVLQGCYTWMRGFNECGHEWRDIPTVDWEEPKP